jgi:hypothetical protein
VVLGNHEDGDWSKSNKFAPILQNESLCLLVSMAVKKQRPLHQGDCKNAFCQGILPPEEVTIVCPPSGNPTRILTNIGSFYKHSTAYGTALGIGTTKIMPSSNPLV